MKITLKQLHASFAALNRMAEEKPAAKTAYKLGRVVKNARSEMETLLEHQNKLLRQYGTEMASKPGFFSFPNGNREIYEKEWNDLLTTEVELWGDPFKLADIEADVKLSIDEYAQLAWLIVEEDEVSTV